MLATAVAVGLTGAAVATGMVAQGAAGPADAADAGGGSTTNRAGAAGGRGTPTSAQLAKRGADVRASRSQQRTPLDPDKVAALNQKSGGQVTKVADLSGADPRTVARLLLPEYGFSDSQFGCLDSLWNSESGWNPHADNPTSSAYGIPQALVASTPDLPADYVDDPTAQIRWGLGYIRNSYGTPCSAWEFKQSHDFY